MGHAPPNPRAWLFRVASNLWIDRTRRLRREQPLVGDVPDRRDAESDPRRAREAAATLLGQLSPQERAAVVLKDVFELSLEEAADALSTTVGAVKTALHRARGKLVEPPADEPSAPAAAVLDAFCDAFNAGDLDRLTALLLDNASVEVVGATTQYGQEAARRTVLFGMLFGVKRLATADVSGGMEARFMQGVVPTAPRVEARAHRGGWVLLHWYAHHDGEAVRALTRIEADGDRVAHLQNYFFNPDLVAEVCGELGGVAKSRSNGNRWWLASANDPSRPRTRGGPHVAHTSFPSTVIVLHEGARRALRARSAVHEAPRRSRGRRRPRHVPEALADGEVSCPSRRGARTSTVGRKSSLILEYVDQRHAQPARLIPSDPDGARECRLRDRFYDLYVNVPMGKIVTDKLRPVDKRDPYGVEQAKAQLETAYAIAGEWMRASRWAAGDAFTMADCAAAPALFYANQVLPFGDGRKHLTEYFARLTQRPSFARVLDEAKPYWSMFPG